jgi:hypothetical protein
MAAAASLPCLHGEDVSRRNGAARLTRVLVSDPEPNVCAAAVDALARGGDASAAPTLERLLERFPDEPYSEFSVRMALAPLAATAS